ncbi:MAG: stage II sporulation protein M [Hyphomicrobiales bacterium]|nr:stage II sporulation protein M [Hyphomicrobiales bacterium]
MIGDNHALGDKLPAAGRNVTARRAGREDFALGETARGLAENRPGTRPVLVLRSAEFRKGREPGWRELDALLSRAEKRGVASLSTVELERLPLLYRGALSSLSVARSIALDRNLLRYLENLALRGYLTVYGPQTGILASLAEFLRRGFPAAVRNARWHVVVATLAILVGVGAGYMLVAGDEDWFSSLVPAGVTGGRGPSSTAAELRQDEIFAPWPGFTRSFVVFANSLFRHNATIGILTFGLGLAFGVPTLLLLVYQGLVFGAFLALHERHGLILDFMGWVSIHGVTEFLAIILCGAGGLLVAEKIVFPGRISRLQNLAKNGRGAATMAAGAVLLFFVAGLIEGGFRQMVDTTMGRFAFAAVTGLGWFAYFLSGHGKTNASE